MHTGSNDGSYKYRKFLKASSYSLIFINEKNPFIDQQLSKMQGKFEINWNYYSTDPKKFIYAKNSIRRKTLQHLKLSLHINLIMFFAIIKDLFNHLENIFGNSHSKKYIIKKF